MVLLRPQSELAKRLVVNPVRCLISPNLRRLSEGGWAFLQSVVRGNWELWQLVHREKIDVVIYNGVGPSIYGSGLNFLSRPQTVIIHHNIQLGKLYALYLKYVPFKSKIVCVSQAVRASIETESNHKRVRIIYNGLAVQPMDYSAKLTNVQVVRIAMAGHITHWKGFHIFLAALQQLQVTQEIQVEILGEAWTRADLLYLEQLKTYVQDHELSDWVQFRGFVPLTEVLPSTHILVHASVEPEPLGLVILEGMQYQCVVIASALGGVPEIIRNGENGFLYAAGNSQQLARILTEILQQLGTPRMRDLIKAGALTVRQQFNLEKQAQTYQELFEDNP